MKYWNVYVVYAEDYEDVYKLYVPAPNKKGVEEFMSRCSLDIIKIKEFENFGIDTDYLATAMKNHGFGDAEIDVVNRILDRVGLSMQIVNQRR